MLDTLMMVQHFTVLPESSDIFLKALNEEDFFDLEDGLQMKCAEQAHLDYIVTENLKDFAASKIKAINIAEALQKLQMSP